jgi:hypothetical protein
MVIRILVWNADSVADVGAESAHESVVVGRIGDAQAAFDVCATAAVISGAGIVGEAERRM